MELGSGDDFRIRDVECRFRPHERGVIRRLVHEKVTRYLRMGARRVPLDLIVTALSSRRIRYLLEILRWQKPPSGAGWPAEGALPPRVLEAKMAREWPRFTS